MGCVQSSQEIDQRENVPQQSANANQASNQRNRQDQNPRGRSLNQNSGGGGGGQRRSQRESGGAGGGGNGGQTQQQRLQYLQNQTVETIVPNKFSGEGVKRTPAYETPMSKHNLTKWRNEFWETRTSGQRHIWNCIRSACEETFETAEALILAADLQMPQNSLTLCIDESGVYYRVPICLINDPIGYDADFQAEKMKNKKQPPEVPMTLKVRHAVRGDLVFSLSNLMLIKDFKSMYVNKLNDPEVLAEKCRMFAMGKELKDDLFIFSYDIINESTVQVMIKK